MLLGDQPISNSLQDKLDRADFCKYLAKAVLSYQSKECIVIGLLGSWGSGKSSMLNMIIEFLYKGSKRQSRFDKPIVVKFNPWNYPDQNGIMAHFFYNLASKLKSKRQKKLQKLSDRVLKYAESFIPFQVSVSSLGKPVSLKLKKRDKKSIDYKKEKLAGHFCQIRNKIVIIIDDIDRLSVNGIKNIFQLIKAFGNLPNIIYIVAFDRGIVSKALCDNQLKNGEEYLEKIIQVPFEIPSIPREKVLAILQFQLNEILGSVPKDIWNQEYWYNVYHSSIQHFFYTIRDVIRYVNTLKIGLPYIYKEVNPIDFIAITCLQVFMPQVYLEIKENKEIFTGVSFEQGDELRYRDSETVENILELVSKKDREHIKRLMCYLFPRLQNILDLHQTAEVYKPSELLKERRICSPNFFDIHFRLSVPEYEVNQADISRLIEASESEKKLSSMLLSANEVGKIQLVIESLRDRISDIPEKNINTVIRSFLDIADNFKIEDAYSDTCSDIVHLCISLLFKVEDEEERYDILERAINDAGSLYISTALILKLISENKRKKFLIDGFKVMSLEELVVRKIRNWVKSKKIDKNPKIHSIIYNWAELENKNQAKEFLNDFIKSHKGFLSFITSNLKKKYIFEKGDYVPRLEFDMDIEKIVDFIDIPVGELELRIKNIINSEQYEKLDKKEKIALKTFTRKIS
jgi:predicted KAP-like P-loop ATPase